MPKKSSALHLIFRKILRLLLLSEQFAHIHNNRCCNEQGRIYPTHNPNDHCETESFDIIATEDEHHDQGQQHRHRRVNRTTQRTVQCIVNGRFQFWVSTLAEVFTNTVKDYYGVIDSCLLYTSDAADE